MAQLTIIGHETRGKEVIEILEMLGGNNTRKHTALYDNLGYYIDNETRDIYYNYPRNFDIKDAILFTIEEFLEKFPYKIGDKVQHSKGIGIITSMHWNNMSSEVQYNVCVNNETWLTSVNFLKHCKEKETVEENLTIQDIRDNNAEWLLNKLQEVSAKKVLQVISDLYDKLRKPKYPKTFVECCEILYPNEIFQLIAPPFKGHNYKQLFALQQLLICRDAYWKIAGEQMGLGKPWGPDWSNLSVTSHDFIKINNGRFIYSSRVLVFPTSEICDTFYENFKDLIEQCKELL